MYALYALSQFVNEGDELRYRFVAEHIRVELRMQLYLMITNYLRSTPAPLIPHPSPLTHSLTHHHTITSATSKEEKAKVDKYIRSKCIPMQERLGWSVYVCLDRSGGCER